tara:strand:+ start:3340 stop:4824 length:1485 start_codon:yes stop_codon:yes gene_type:complete
MSVRSFTAAAIIAASSIAATTANAQLIRDSFTYQGTLSDNGAPANGLYDITFLVYDDEVGGFPITNGTVSVNNVQVTDGLFSTEINFGVIGEIFNANTTRWLELRISEAGQPGVTILEPRQKLTPATLANYALRAGFAEFSGTSLEDAYENDNSILLQSAHGPLELWGTTGQAPILDFYSNFGDRRARIGVDASFDAGYINLEGPGGISFARLERDISGLGGGFLILTRNNNGSSGILLEGNVNNTQSSSVSIFGSVNSIFLDASETGNASVRLPTGAISATEMFNEPGVAETTASSGMDLTQNPSVTDVLSSVTIDAPTSGYVLVIASAELTINHINGTTSSAVNLGVSNTSTAFQNNLDLETRIDHAQPTGSYDHAVTTHAIFTAGPGINTYYFLGNFINTNGATATVLDQQLSAIFIPTSYGASGIESMQSIPDEFTPSRGPMTQLDILAEQNAALQANAARQQRELEEMRTMMQQMQQQINEQTRQQSRD